MHMDPVLLWNASKIQIYNINDQEYNQINQRIAFFAVNN